MSEFEGRAVDLSDGRQVCYGEHENYHYFRFKNAEGVETSFKLSSDAFEAMCRLIEERRA